MSQLLDPQYSHAPAPAPALAASAPVPVYLTGTPTKQPMVIVGIDMSIWSMAKLIIKFWIASIPAMMIFSILWLVVGGIFMLVFGGLLGGLTSTLF